MIDVIRELESFGVTVHVHDPVATPEEALHEYGVHLTDWQHLPRANAIIAAVAHRPFKARSVKDFVEKLSPRGLFIDVKGIADREALQAQGITVWRL